MAVPRTGLARRNWGPRAWAGLSARVRGLRLELVIAVQGGIAAGIAWFVAHNVLDHAQPFFAPISAVIVLGAAAGQRWRRALELVLGVALGIAIGDAFILLIGVGVFQIAIVVVLAILAAAFLGGGQLVVNQAAASAVLVSTLAPPSGGIYLGRFVDAMVGGLTGLAVMALVLPFNPLTRVRRSAGAALDVLSAALAMGAEALTRGDPAGAQAGLERLRAIEGEHLRLRASLEAGQETATMSPLRWRSRPALARYVEAEVHVERAVRNARVLMRRVTLLVGNHEPVPPDLIRALRLLGDAVASLRAELHRGETPERARELLTDAVRAAGLAYLEGVGFSGSVVVAQVRSAAVDLLRATGVGPDEADATVRRATPPPAEPAG